jgi:hypothetical protein
MLTKKAVNQPNAFGLRRSSVAKLRLDSMTIMSPSDTSELRFTLMQQKQVFQYDAYGHMRSSETFMANEDSGKLLPTNKIAYAYDAYGFKTADSTYSFDEAGANPLMTEIIQYQFLPNGNKIMEKKLYTQYGYNSWSDEYGYTYEYDALNRQTVQFSSIMSSTGEWTVNRKTEFAYGPLGGLSSQTSSFLEYSTSKWIGSERQDHLRDASNRDSVVLWYNYYAFENNWALGNRDRYFYDASGDTTLHFFDLWNSGTKTWLDNAKYVFAYDKHGNKTLEARYVWMQDSLKWGLRDKEEWAYDQKNNLLSQAQYEDWSEDGSLMIVMKTILNYDPTRFNADVVEPFMPDEISAFNLLTSANLYLMLPTMDSLLVGIVNFHYSTMEVLGNPIIRQNTTDWYRLSAQNQLNFPTSNATAELSVFDLQGCVRLQRKVQTGETVSLAELAKGLYLIRLSGPDGVRQGKVLVR